MGSRPPYILLFSLLFIVYCIGLFVPLLDNDAAHHANIAMHMYLTGDYVSLIDNGRDYLDKPHLLFWLCALSYHIFGVTSFAYRFPSLIFSILGVWSTYRLGKTLYNKETGRLSALLLASAFGFILACTDVRMEGVLTASIIFATWQLVEYVNRKNLLHAFGAALGLALAFCTKGHIGVITPAIAVFFYILFKKDWKSLYHWQLLVILLSFFILISPVVYCFYLQFDLHPEKVIRGRSGRSGVQFILWQQSAERYQGETFGGASKNDYFFFFHSFLWLFAPWSLLTYIALFNRVKTFRQRKYEWMTAGSFLVIALLINFSGYKLPHYLHIIFPMAAILTASWLMGVRERSVVIRRLSVMQWIICTLCLLLIAVVSFWSFPVRNVLVLAGLILMAATAFVIVGSSPNRFCQTVSLSVLTSCLVFYLLNAHFYPTLLTYQGGNEAAFATRKVVNPHDVYYWPGLYSPSYEFYSQTIKKTFNDRVLREKDSVWVLTDNKLLPKLKEKGLPILELHAFKDYDVTRLKPDFFLPKTRQNLPDSIYLVRVK